MMKSLWLRWLLDFVNHPFFLVAAWALLCVLFALAATALKGCIHG